MLGTRLRVFAKFSLVTADYGSRWRVLRYLAGVICVVAALTIAGEATAKPKTHVVQSGQTLGRIAKRYSVSIQAICTANGIRRRDPIRPGQKLVIPDASDRDGSQAARRGKTGKKESKKKKAKTSSASAERALRTLEVAGSRVYYYTPTGRGRLTLRPVLMYLHGRGGNAKAACRRWGKVARPMGWVVCPAGPFPRGGGFEWKNNWPAGRTIVMGALQALRKKYGRRVQLYGNTIIGFSEGAFIAMNVGVREQRAFNRWLILAADSSYWGPKGRAAFQRRARRVHRVYLITGKDDRVYDGTLELRGWLRKAGVPVRMKTPGGLGHQLALESRPAMYRAALHWLNR